MRSARGLECSGFSLGKAESEVRRAQAKTFVRAIKPLRRLLRNQGAVNDSMIIAVSELIDVTEKMARRVELLDVYFGALKKQVRQIDSKEVATLEPDTQGG